MQSYETLMGLQQQAQQSASSGLIDKKTEEVAKMLCRENGRYAIDWPFKIDGGGFVPSWVMFVSEATKLISQYERLDFITHYGAKK